MKSVSLVLIFLVFYLPLYFAESLRADTDVYPHDSCVRHIAHKKPDSSSSKYGRNFKSTPNKSIESAAKKLEKINKSLIVATEKGDLKGVTVLLANGADVNAKNSNGDTALILSALKGHMDCMKALIANGASMNAKNSNGDTALIMSASKGHMDCIWTLIANGADVNAKNINGDTALIISTLKGDMDCMRALIANGADVNVKNNDGDTALIISALKGEMGCMRALIINGAGVNAKNTAGDTALIISALKGDMDCTSTLIAFGADVNAKNINGDTALMVAAKNGRTDVLNILKAADDGKKETSIQPVPDEDNRQRETAKSPERNNQAQSQYNALSSPSVSGKQVSTDKEISTPDSIVVSHASGRMHPDYPSLIFTLAIVWSIGLISPLTIRYIFLKRPIESRPAIGICALFLMINLMLFSAIPANPKAGKGIGTLLIAIASYWILRSGAPQQKEQEQKAPPEEEPSAEGGAEETNGNGQKDGSPGEREIYYRKILNIKEHATFSDIKTVYRKLVQQYHPDKVRSLGPKIRTVAEVEIRHINEAYAYFCNKYKQ